MPRVDYECSNLIALIGQVTLFCALNSLYHQVRVLCIRSFVLYIVFITIVRIAQQLAQHFSSNKILNFLPNC